MEENEEKKVVNEQKPEKELEQKTETTQKKESTAFSVISFIFGLLSIAFFFFAIISIPSAILAIVFAVLDRKVNTSTLSVAGLVMGIITLSLYVIVLFTCLIAGFAFDGIVTLIEALL